MKLLPFNSFPKITETIPGMIIRKKELMNIIAVLPMKLNSDNVPVNRLEKAYVIIIDVPSKINHHK